MSLFYLASQTAAGFLLSAVDELFREANVRPNGVINYEEFTRMVTLPPVDYWVFKKKIIIQKCLKITK